MKGEVFDHRNVCDSHHAFSPTLQRHHAERVEVVLSRRLEGLNRGQIYVSRNTSTDTLDHAGTVAERRQQTHHLLARNLLVSVQRVLSDQQRFQLRQICP